MRCWIAPRSSVWLARVKTQTEGAFSSLPPSLSLLWRRAFWLMMGGQWVGLCTRFVTMPGAGDADLRMTYCAFAVCALLGDWSCIDLPRALSYIQRCRVRVPYLHPTPFLLYLTRACENSQTYEGGYAQTPLGESLGGPTYCALAALYLVPADHACAPQAHLQRAEWHATVRWLLHMQVEALASVGGGGFAGRTNKLADACYGFWCSAALAVRPVSSPVVCGVRSSSAVPMGRPRGTPVFCRLDPWCWRIARCARARRVSSAVPVQIWWDRQSAGRTSR